MSAPVASAGPTDLATATITMPVASGNDVVHGFANQVPLALALRQIVPPAYNFSIDQDVDGNTLVSYNGGKPWRDTLGDLLAPSGLTFHVDGSSVTISHSVAAAAPAVAAPPQPTVVVPLPAPSVISASAADTIGASNPAFSTVSVGSTEGWSAERGDTLRKVLTNWCARSGFQLQWLAEYDYPIEASAHFSGSFESAVRDLLAGFVTAEPQPIGELHANANADQKVLVVQARGNSYSN